MDSESPWPTLGRVLVERGVITQDRLEQALVIQRASGGLLGDILTSKGWVTPLSIAAALARQREVLEHRGHTPPQAAPGTARGERWRPLGHILVEKGFITEVELKQALAAQTEERGFIGEILVQRGWLTASDLVFGLAAQLGLDVAAGTAGRGGTVLSSDRPPPHFEVIEAVEGESVVLKKATTFMEATDYVFDEVLWQREPGKLEIVRVDSNREIVWSFTPGEAPAVEGDDLLSIFGYPVTQWRGSKVLYEKTATPSGRRGPSVAAAG
jgi:hypothetical protein